MITSAVVFLATAMDENAMTTASTGHDKHYRLDGIDTRPPPDPGSHFGGGHQNIKAVLAEVDRLGIPRLP